MTTSSPLKSAIKDKIRSNLGIWQYKPNITERISELDSFREILVSNSKLCDIDTSQKNRITVTISESRYHSSIQKDFHYNHIRITALLASLKALDSTVCSSAWRIVTCYYTSFFSAFEVLKLLGMHLNYFDRGDIEIIKANSKTSTYHLEEGTYLGKSKLDPIEGFVIELSKQNVRHHQLIWANLERDLNSIAAKSNAIDAPLRRKLLSLLGNRSKGLLSPSELRNRWNYQSPELFGTLGESIAQDFSKIIGLQAPTESWFSRSTISKTESECLCGMACLSTILTDTLKSIQPMIEGR